MTRYKTMGSERKQDKATPLRLMNFNEVISNSLNPSFHVFCSDADTDVVSCHPIFRARRSQFHALFFNARWMWYVTRNVRQLWMRRSVLQRLLPCFQLNSMPLFDLVPLWYPISMRVIWTNVTMKDVGFYSSLML